MGDRQAFGWDPERTLFVLWSGINDINMLFISSSPTEPLLKAKMQILSQNFLPILRDAGAKQLVVFNAPPFDRVAWESPATRAKRKRLIELWNSRLKREVDRFASRNPSLRIFQFDVHAAQNRILDHPEAYGLASAMQCAMRLSRSLMAPACATRTFLSPHRSQTLRDSSCPSARRLSGRMPTRTDSMSALICKRSTPRNCTERSPSAL